MIYFLYNVPASVQLEKSWFQKEIYANFETDISINKLISHLRKYIPDIELLNIANNNWFKYIDKYPIFNYTYGFGRLIDCIHPSYLLEASGNRYFGATPLGILLSSNKPHSNSLMKALGYLVPKEYLLVSEIKKEEAQILNSYFSSSSFLVLKPAYEESSLGLRLIENEPDNIFNTVNEVYANIKAPLLLQEYIDGEDVTIPIIGYEEAFLLPAVVLKHEKKSSQPFLFEAASKATKSGLKYESMDGYPEKIKKNIYKMAKDAFYITHQRDYARLDLRLSSNGQCYFLEMNSNPQLGLDKASFAVSASLINLEVGEIFRMILDNRIIPSGLFKSF
ncbi:hypothetical protein WBJ53_05420 [Spirosoma sp. SC4-14]|uniref:hypothetical protein n=1 Tax=Spirosoma sp. SC4-14 TaxID=3128900 RepID=UPI0030D4A2FE